MTSNAGSSESGDLPPLMSEGLDWLFLILSGRATKDDYAALERWKNQSPAHVEALANAIKLRQLIAAQEEFSQTKPSFFQQPLTRRAAFGGVSVAAASYAFLSPPLNLWPSLAELSADYRTAVGERREIALAKGLSVEMNTRTSLSLHSRPGRPGVRLVAGEIAITANLPAAAPFTVFAGNGRVVASQASFDLSKDDSGVKVLCLDGEMAVEVDSARHQLKPRQQWVYSRDRGTVTTASVDPELVTAWRQGRLLFHNAPFETIVAEINRYRSGKIVVMNARLAARRFNGAFEINKVASIVGDLQKLSNASATVLPGDIIVLS